MRRERRRASGGERQTRRRIRTVRSDINRSTCIDADSCPVAREVRYGRIKNAAVVDDPEDVGLPNDRVAIPSQNPKGRVVAQAECAHGATGHIENDGSLVGRDHDVIRVHAVARRRIVRNR